jgi:penicillin-binding protein 1A
MGGKTGTTNSNADFWFMGYTPQLLGGAWVGCDDRFITIESSAFYGGSVARPIWEAFFKKVYADKTLGIERDARFVQPADYNNQINSADLIPIEIDPNPAGEGEDQGVGTEEDYNISNDYIGPESKPVVDEQENPAKKDTSNSNNTDKKKGDNKPIGSAADEPKKKKGFLKKLFGKKEGE